MGVCTRSECEYSRNELAPAAGALTPSPNATDSACVVERARVLVHLHAVSAEDGSVRTMTRAEHDRAARGRGELARDRWSRRVSSVIDAQRRLTAREPRDARAKADPPGPSDPRYGYLKRTYD